MIWSVLGDEHESKLDMSENERSKATSTKHLIHACATNSQHSLPPPNGAEDGPRYLLSGSPGLGSGSFQRVATASGRRHNTGPDSLLAGLGGAAGLDDGHHVGHNVAAELGVEIADGHLLGRAVQADTGQEGRLPLLLDALGGPVGDPVDATLDLTLQVLEEEVDLRTAGTVDATCGNFNGIRVGVIAHGAAGGGGGCSGRLTADIAGGGIVIHGTKGGALDCLARPRRAWHGWLLQVPVLG